MEKLLVFVILADSCSVLNFVAYFVQFASVVRLVGNAVSQGIFLVLLALTSLIP